MKRIIFALLLLGSGLLVAQQAQKKPVTHDVYDSWKKIVGESISANGQWVGYTLEPQEGDASLVLFERGASRYDTIPRGTGARFTMKADYCAFQIRPFFKDIRKARIDKKKAPDQPKDSLGIMRLSDRTIVKIPRVASCKLPEKGSGWIAYLLEKELPAADSTKKKDAKKADGEDAADDDKDKKDEKGSTLVARELTTGRDTTFKYVAEYIFTKD